jgi:hypothetical protein
MFLDRYFGSNSGPGMTVLPKNLEGRYAHPLDFQLGFFMNPPKVMSQL